MTYKDNKPNKLLDSKEGYDLTARTYDQKLSFLNGFENDVIYSMLRDLKGKKVLDIGCGTGRIIKPLIEMGGEITAGDVSGEMLKVVNEKFPNVKTVLADVNDLPFSDDYFDIIIASFLFVHVWDLEKAFNEVYRALKPGGVFIATNINQRKPPKIEVKSGQLKHIIIKSFYHRPEDFIEALNNCLFTIEKEEFVFDHGIWINQIVKSIK